MEYKAVLVGLTVCDDNVGELLDYFDGGGVHQVYGPAVIGLSKVLAFRESGKDISRPAQRYKQQHRRRLCGFEYQTGSVID